MSTVVFIFGGCNGNEDYDMLTLNRSGQVLHIEDQLIPVQDYAAVVVGSGAAGLAAALRLARGGINPLALVTENRLSGTSRNTGSDKQTYYKLSLAGDDQDSIGSMARTLFDGGCVDGDLARIEAALSADCFHWLCDMGVPFPRNAYGEAIGYKTDHDPKNRATSAGPLTSRLMVEVLEKELAETDLEILDHWQVIRILTDMDAPPVLPAGSDTGQSAFTKRVQGLLCLNRGHYGDPGNRYLIIRTERIVYAVGGPAMLYADSVYPASQMGATVLGLEAGALGKNLTEWQYGLASIRPRWNVSGSYQQALPCYISTDKTGKDRREFLADWIPDVQARLGAVFRKGYQWPLDARKMDGSSLIDLLVYQETVLKKRRVYLDFRTNPGGLPDLAVLDAEAADYLKRSGAIQETPIQRLRALNLPAVEFYRSQGVDLSADMLEIRLCAQHHNGGLSADANWESRVRGLFPIGEVNGSHGIYRPGGSALNSGQVGAMRASAAILASWRRYEKPGVSQNSNQTRAGAGRPIRFSPAVMDQLTERINWLEGHLANGQIGQNQNEAQESLAHAWQRATRRMSRIGGPFRPVDGLAAALDEVVHERADLDRASGMVRAPGLSMLCRYRELLLTQQVYLAAMLDYAGRGGGSRGSAIYLDDAGGLPLPTLPEYFRCRAQDPDWPDRIQEVSLADGQVKITWRPVRPLPHPDDVFEKTWRTFRREEGLDDA